MESNTVIDLQQLCAITICSQAWEIPSIQHKIRQLFLQNKYRCHDYGMKRNLSQIQSLFQRRITNSKLTYSDQPGGSSYLQELEQDDVTSLKCKWILPQDDLVFRDFKKISHLVEEYNDLIINVLPLKLKIYCQDMLLMMGENIYFWLEYLRMDIKVNAKLPDKIYWLPNGTVNEKKIFDIWEKDEDILRERSVFFEAPILHILACIYVREDFIKNHQDEMEHFLKIHLPEFQLKNYNDIVYTLIALYLVLMILIERADHEKYDINSSGYVIPPTKMFEMCAFAGLSMPVHYFWSIIKKTGYQEEYLMNFTINYVKVLGATDEPYLRNKMVEIAVFLISQIPFYHRNEFIQKNAKFLFTGLLPVSAYNRIIPQLVKYICSGPSVSTYIFSCFQKLINLMNMYGTMTWRVRHLRELFELFFANLSKDLLPNFFEISFINFRLEKGNGFDLPCLNFMLSYLDKNTRNKIIIGILPGIISLVEKEFFEEISQYIKEVLNSEERNAWKEYFLNDGVKNLILQFYLIDELWDLFAVTKEERDVIKKSQDHLKICEYFTLTEYRYDRAEMYLEWIFDNEEEREQFRYSLPSNFFIRDNISRIWNEILYYTCINQKFYDLCYKHFFGVPEELTPEELLEFCDYNFYDFRKSFGKWILEEDDGFWRGPFKLPQELPEVFMKWVCKEQALRRDIIFHYRDDEERQFFGKITRVLMRLAEYVKEKRPSRYI